VLFTKPKQVFCLFSTERVKIFPQNFFALKVGLGREELQGIHSSVKFEFKFITFNSSAYSYEDDIIIIVLGGKSGQVCLGDRSGRSEHIPTDLKGLLVLVVLVVFALCIRVVSSSNFVFDVSVFYQLIIPTSS
jgi:hypothetical protein